VPLPAPTPEIEIRREPLESPSAMSLLRRFEAEIGRRYPGLDFSKSPSASAAELAPPAGRFVIAYLNRTPAGCAGLKRLDSHTAEIKRLFVAPEARRRGIGRALLRRLENEAAEIGYGRLRLDTGDRQPESLALFRSLGYREIPDYNGNRYAAHWMEKGLPDL
jgi:GNAT superfamily N-acetyltransferase